jgi:predicted DsbA family dithiol-disulfide isomerase
MARRQAVRRVDPRLGGQVFEHDPHGLPGAFRHRLEIRIGQAAAERLHDDIGQREHGRRDGGKCAHADAACGLVGNVGAHSGHEAREARDVVDPQRHRNAVLARQLARQPPRHAGVAEVVDDAAEDVPAQRRRHGGWVPRDPAPLSQLVRKARSSKERADAGSGRRGRGVGRVCPWCYIGKRRLESAIAELREANPDLPFEIRWHPFQLNPDLPAEGVDRKAYLEHKFGGPERAKQIYERVSAAGETVGIPFDFDAIKRQPNTLLAHRLVAWAQSRKEGDPDALVEGLFRANFIEGRYVGSVDELVAIAIAAGYDPTDARAFLESDDLKDVVAQSDHRAREMGISGVPFFIFDGKTALSGAQEPATIVQAIAQARGSTR